MSVPPCLPLWAAGVCLVEEVVLLTLKPLFTEVTVTCVLEWILCSEIRLEK